jgi:hypothetical protein
VIWGNLAALFRHDQVFVASNLFWYPVEGHPEIVIAPDAFVVFGRPKGDRSSYRQWEEDNLPVLVAFEVLSPKNTVTEMADKLLFYEEYGVEEYYVYDPDTNKLMVYLRRGTILARHTPVEDFVSPRLKIRFDLSGPQMRIFYPDGRRFVSFEELEEQREREQHERLSAEQRASQAEQRVSQAEERVSQAEERVRHAERRADRLAELSRKARQQQASAEELAELEALEQPLPPAS